MRINDNDDGDDDNDDDNDDNDDDDDDDDDDDEDDKTTYQGTLTLRSQLSLRWTPLGPAVSVHLREIL